MEDEVIRLSEEEEIVIDDEEKDIKQDLSIAVLTHHSDSVYCVKLHKHSNTINIVSGGGDDKAFIVSINDISNISNDNIITTELKGDDNNLESICVCTVINTLLFTGSMNGVVRIYNNHNLITTFTTLESQEEAEIQWIKQYNHSNKNIVSVFIGSADSEVYRVDVFNNNSANIYKYYTKISGSVTLGLFSSDNLLVGGEDGFCFIYKITDTDNSIHISETYNYMQLKLLHVFPPKMTHRGNVITTSKSNNKTEKKSDEIVYGITAGFSSIKYSSILYVGTIMGDFSVVNSQNGKLIKKIKVASKNDSSVETIQECPISGFSWLLVALLDGMIYIYDEHFSVRCCINHNITNNSSNVSITKAIFSPINQFVIICSDNEGKIILYDTRQINSVGVANESGKIVLTGHSDAILDFDVVCINSNNNLMIVTASEDSTCRIFKI